MTSEQYRTYLTESIKTGAQMMYDMAEDIAGKSDFISNLTVTIKFDPEKGGDFDTIAVWSLRFPDGSEDIIHKFYKEDSNEKTGWKEIDEDEFREREAVCNSR